MLVLAILVKRQSNAREKHPNVKSLTVAALDKWSVFQDERAHDYSRTRRGNLLILVDSQSQWTVAQKLNF